MVNICGRCFINGAKFSFFVNAAGSVAHKLYVNYKEMSKEERLRLAKLFIDNIERAKTYLLEAAYKDIYAFDKKTMQNIINHLSFFEGMVANMRFGDTRPNVVNRNISDFLFISSRLENDMLIDEIMGIASGKYPAWYGAVNQKELKERLKRLSMWYMKHYKKPIIIDIDTIR